MKTATQKLPWWEKLALIVFILSILELLYLPFSSIFLKGNARIFYEAFDALIIFYFLAFVVLIVFLMMNVRRANLSKKYELEFFKKTFCLSCGQAIIEQDGSTLPTGAIGLIGRIGSMGLIALIGLIGLIEPIFLIFSQQSRIQPKKNFIIVDKT